MREIKFRAWLLDRFDSYNGQVYIAKWKMVDVHSLHFGSNKIMFTGGTTKTPRAQKINAECIIEQFTGVLDKNSKKIYEGDIVRATDANTHEYDDEIDDSVSFIGSCFSLSESWETLDYFGSNNLEVIGNIHENPELLK